ncbi:MAG: hypothetical protein QOH28_2332 [Actinomycetota bacterium]|nr:hypothetical protein [Actinomycetota bacterium]
MSSTGCIVPRSGPVRRSRPRTCSERSSRVMPVSSGSTSRWWSRSDGARCTRHYRASRASTEDASATVLTADQARSGVPIRGSVLRTRADRAVHVDARDHGAVGRSIPNERPGVMGGLDEVRGADAREGTTAGSLDATRRRHVKCRFRARRSRGGEACSQRLDAIAAEIGEYRRTSGDGHGDRFARAVNLETVAARPRDVRREESQPASAATRGRKRVGMVEHVEQSLGRDGPRSVQRTPDVLMVNESVCERQGRGEPREGPAAD